MIKTILRNATLLAALTATVNLYAQKEVRMTTAEYVDRYKHIAIEHQEKYGIPASITLAQGILESDSGNGRLAVEANNHFGIKCKSNWCEYDGTVYTQATVYDENWNQTVSLGRLCGKDYVEDDFADLSSAGIKACYGLDVNPATGDFVLTDAGDYVTPGAVHYFSADGSLLWSHRAGVCPSRIVWIYED